MTRRIHRGEVRSYRAGSDSPRRLVVVLARDGAIPFLSAISVAPITTAVRGLPSEVLLGEGFGLRAPAAVNLDAVMTVSQARLGELVGRLSANQLDRVRAAVHVAMGFDSANYKSSGPS